MNAQSIFDELRAAATKACNDRDYRPLVKLAEDLAMRQAANSKSTTLADLVLTDAAGSRVQLAVWWYDPSGPTQNIPDMTRMRLTLQQPGGQAQEWTGEYEG